MAKRKRTRTARSNNLLLEHLIFQGSNAEQTSIENIRFDHEHLSRQTITADNLNEIKSNRVNWIQVKGLSDTALIGELCEKFNLPTLSIQDILNTRHIGKIEEVNGLVLAVIDMFSYNDENELRREHFSFVLGKNIVISFQESKTNYFDIIERALEQQLGQVRHQQSDYLFNLLLSSVVDRYLETLEILQNSLLDMEDLLMEFKTDRSNIGQEIQRHRHDYLRLKRGIWPIKEQFNQLILWEYPIINKQNQIYFRDTNDHLQQAYMMVEGNRETIASLLDLYLANNDLRMNHIMKQLTVVSTIFIPLTFLVGVWGMNFKFMPELDWRYGYLFAWIAMLIAGVVSYIYFRRKKWY